MKRHAKKRSRVLKKTMLLFSKKCLQFFKTRRLFPSPPSSSVFVACVGLGLLVVGSTQQVADGQLAVQHGME
jgi:hypothetical protein